MSEQSVDNVRERGHFEGFGEPVNNSVDIPRWLRISAALLVGACSPKETPVDQTGAAPRVICLTPSSTEAVAAVAGPEVLVGVDRFSNYPPVVAELPRVGGFVDPNLEAILRLRPTLVVMDDVQRSIEGSLHAAGIKTVILDMKTVDQLRSGLLTLGRLLHRQAAASAAVAQLDEQIAGVRATAALQAAGRVPRVLFVVDRDLGALGTIYVAGSGNYLDELIQLAGGQNVFGDSRSQFLKISAEQVMRAAPDVIIDAVHTQDSNRATDDWKVLTEVPAVRDGRVYVIGEADFNHPSPRLPLHLATIVDLIYR